MASPSQAYRLSSDALDQWRAAGGERVTYSEAGWSGAAIALVAHASLHFFSVAIPALERSLVLFAPVERLALGIGGAVPGIARWLALLGGVAVWGALIGMALLTLAHETPGLLRRARHR